MGAAGICIFIGAKPVFDISSREFAYAWTRSSVL
jgi:hypothetical protein